MVEDAITARCRELGLIRTKKKILISSVGNTDDFRIDQCIPKAQDQCGPR